MQPAYRPENLSIPAADGNSNEANVAQSRKMTVYLSGTFTANVQFQVSPEVTGANWVDEGALQTGPAELEITKACVRVRAVVSGYVSGTPVGILVHG